MPEIGKGKLIDAFESTAYAREKLLEAIRNPESGHAEIGGSYIDGILAAFEEFKTGLQSREFLEDYEGVEETLEELAYPLQELRAYFHNPDQTHIVQKDAHIFVRFVNQQIAEWVKWAKKLDEGYYEQ